MRMMGVMERELKARRRERVNKQDVRVVASDGERHKWQTRKTNDTRSGTMNETHARLSCSSDFFAQATCREPCRMAWFLVTFCRILLSQCLILLVSRSKAFNNMFFTSRPFHPRH